MAFYVEVLIGWAPLGKYIGEAGVTRVGHLPLDFSSLSLDQLSSPGPLFFVSNSVAERLRIRAILSFPISLYVSYIQDIKKQPYQIDLSIPGSGKWCSTSVKAK